MPFPGKLGCRASRPRDLLRAAWLPHFMRDVPAAPPTCQRTTGYRTWGMKQNDRYGCCVVSGAVHKKQAASFCNTPQRINDIGDAELVRVYLSLSPGDDGLNIGDWLKWQTKQQQPWAADAYGATDPRNPDELKKTLWWLGGVTLGIGVPDRWGNNTQNGFVWDAVGRFDGVGHDVEAVDYNERGLEIITWGLRGTITWAGLAEQCGEAWAVLPPDWYAAGKSVQGLNVTGLRRYLAFITGQTPPPGPDPEPAPNPDPTPVPPPPPPPIPDAMPCERGMKLLSRGQALWDAGYRDLVKEGIGYLEQKWGAAQ